MNPKSGRPLRFFNPLAIWTDIALKSGEAMLAAAQAAITRPKPPTVAVIDSKAKRKSAKRPRKSAASRAKRRAR